MSKLTSRLSTEKFDIEIVKDSYAHGVGYMLWVNNNTIKEHVSVALTANELRELQELLRGIII